MARDDDRGGDGGDGSSGSDGGKKGKKGKKGKHPTHPKQPRQPSGRHGGHRGHRGSGGHRGSAHKPHVVHPGVWHEATGAGSIGHTAGTNPAQGHPAGSGMAAHIIRPPLSTGLSDVLLELVGEGTITLGAALGAWQRDQERVTNRAWRRPGGLARMGGL